jgi:hypothetical protein
MPGRALKFVEANGITTEEAYPYKAYKYKCQVDKGEYKTKSHA